MAIVLCRMELNKINERLCKLQDKISRLKKTMYDLDMIPTHEAGHIKKCYGCEVLGCMTCIRHNNEVVFEVCNGCDKYYCVYKCKDTHLRLRHDGKYECKDLNKCYNFIVKF